MSRWFGRLLLGLVVVMAAQMAGGAPVALGASDQEAQNPELTVSLSVPDQARIGDTVQATITIANNTLRLETFTVQGTWKDPSGDASVQNRNGLLLPGQTVTRTIDYLVNEKCLPGTHEVTITVQNRNGASSATANVEVS
jgi:hypothetical protein